jgi:hypothetical protein
MAAFALVKMFMQFSSFLLFPGHDCHSPAVPPVFFVSKAILAGEIKFRISRWETD